KTWPNANIGIRPAEALLVVDVDPRNGGDRQLAGMQRMHHPLPITQTARTGGGGLHIWLRCGTPVTVGKLADGLDVKTRSGYVVVPPSTHASGGRYEWIDLSDVAPAPDYLRHLLAPPRQPRAGTAGRSGATPARAAGLLRIVEEATEGERSNRLYWACRRACEHGLDVEPLIAAAVDLGLSQRAAERTAASAASATGVES
ncbi:MAG: DNA primase, partial [Pseudonocardiales bacterium]